jgi:bacterial/archaeal transporter family-2 protein
VTALAVVLTLVAGVAGAVQLAVMGRFGDRIGTLPALAFANCVAAVLGIAILFTARRSLSGFGDALRQPQWMWLGGLAGTFIVFTITFVAPRIGAVATTAVFIAAQFAMAIVIDRLGLFGLDRIPLAWTRVAGVGLLAAGAALALHRA